MTVDDGLMVRLRRMAMRLTGDANLQQDLVQEMSVYLMDADRHAPGKTLSWYIKGGEYRARNYLTRGRSIDSFKRRRSGTDVEMLEWGEGDGGRNRSDLFDPADLRVELCLKDIVEQLVKLLSAKERQTLGLLLEEFGVCEIARWQGVSHAAIVKQRDKIAQLAGRLLDEVA